MTEVTPVSSVERRVIGLATAPPAVTVAVSVVAVEVDAVEDLAESATIVTNLVTFRESVPKKDKKEEEVDEAGSAVVAVDVAAAEVECATTARDPAIWLATVLTSALNAREVVVSVVVSVVAVASEVVEAEVVAAVAEIVNATSAKAMATSRGIAPMSRHPGQSGARY